ncbi:hypothetical protein HBB16_04615 [Pseudonocardia sp. MCCB 268]|nr:hypothetical protein [Pseudonocardia cytotoxica]
MFALYFALQRQVVDTFVRSGFTMILPVNRPAPGPRKPCQDRAMLGGLVAQRAAGRHGAARPPRAGPALRSVAEIADAASTSWRPSCGRAEPRLHQAPAAAAGGARAGGPRPPPPEPATVTAVFATAIEPTPRRRHHRPGPVDGAVAALAAANRRLFVGLGASAPAGAGRRVPLRLRRVADGGAGRQRRPAPDRRLLAPDDVLPHAVSHSGANRTLAAAAAREAGATTIRISSFADSALIQQVDVRSSPARPVGPDGDRRGDRPGLRTSSCSTRCRSASPGGAPGINRHADAKLAGLLDGARRESPATTRTWTL